jgi:hypothetical protein
MKKMTTKATVFAKRLFILLFMLSSLHVIAQRGKAPHEFFAHAGGGISTYAFSSAPKKASSVGYNFDIGIGFTGFVSQQIGIHVGAGFGQFNVKSKVNALYTLTTNLRDDYFTDPREEFYDLHTYLKGYNDIHKTLFINIPIMFHFQTKQKQYWSWKNTQKAGFYAMGGVKVFFLFNNKYEARIPNMYNEAYFPEMDNWAKTQQFRGFGNFEGNAVKGNLDFGVLATFSIEMGVKWRIENNMFIYTGAFFDCGLNDPIKDSRKTFGNFTDGLDAVKLLEEVTILKYSERANLMSVGIKIHFAFSRKTRPF